MINQEMRLLRLEQIDSPPFVIKQVSYLIMESKREVIKLTRPMVHKERTVLIKRMIREAVNEEIERSIQMRKNQCPRCIHMRYYDEEGTHYSSLPIGIRQVQIIGCDEVRLASKDRCRRFVEQSMATSLEGYVNEMTLLYKFRGVINRIEEIWKEYLLGK